MARTTTPVLRRKKVITVVNKGEMWKDNGEVDVIYLDVNGGDQVHPRCIAKLQVRAKLYDSLYRGGLTRQRTNAVMLHTGPQLRYDGCYAPDVILSWLNAMDADTVAYYDACRRAGWWK